MLVSVWETTTDWNGGEIPKVNTSSKLAIVTMGIFPSYVFNYVQVFTHWVTSQNGCIENIINAGFTKPTSLQNEYIPICCISLLTALFR